MFRVDLADIGNTYLKINVHNLSYVTEEWIKRYLNVAMGAPSQEGGNSYYNDPVPNKQKPTKKLKSVNLFPG